ncbi:MAG: cell division protein ZapA [Candidatus Zixiibacteriota bacterium]|nr:MAG: cell division protein ZapA [candidate division Zixibacteria bacterium]
MADISDKEKTVKVVIFGEEYPIRGDADSEYILRVADYVDRRMKEIALKSKNKSPNRIAILAALNIAGEYLDLKDTKVTDLSEVEDRAKSILDLLDSKLLDTQDS